MGFIRREPYEHFRDGSSAWKNGIRGFLVRWRGQGAALAASLLGGGVFAWQERLSKVPANIEINVYSAFLFGIASLVVVLLAHRRFHLRKMRSRVALHRFAHQIRDNLASAQKQKKYRQENGSQEQATQLFRRCCEELCNRSRDYLKEVIGDPNIQCCIRLADRDNRGNLLYGTAGRSDGLDTGREGHSEPIKEDEGVAKFLKNPNVGMRGVLAIRDLDKAAEAQVYKKTENDNLFKGEIETMGVCPINGWSDNDYVMLGLFHVVSREDSIREEHVDSIKAIADLLGSAIPRIVDAYYSLRGGD